MIEVVMHVIDVMVILMEVMKFFMRSKLSYM